MSLIVGLFVALSSPRLSRALKLFLMLTMISPPFVSSLSYIQLFGRRGLISYRLLGLSLNPYGLWGVVLMQALSYLSLHALLISTAVASIDPAIINSARDLGASTGEIVRDLILGQLKAPLAIVALLNFMKSLADFSTPTIIGGKFSTLATESYLNMVAYGDIGKAAVLNILIFLPSILVYLVYRKYSAGQSRQASQQAPVSYRRKGLLYRFLAAFTALFLGALTLQYLALILEAFIQRSRGKISLTLAHFSAASTHLSGAMLRSVLYSLIAASIGAALGLLIGYVVQLRKSRLGNYLDLLSSLPYVLPGSFFGIAYIYAFRSPPLKLTGSALIVILNVLFKQLPFTAKVGIDAVRAIDPAIFNSIRDLGGSRLRLLSDGIFPLAKESFFVSFANSFSSTMTTVGSILFLVYPGQKLATIVLFDLIQSGKYSVGSALALWIMLLTVAVNAGCFLLLRHGQKSRSESALSRAEKVGGINYVPRLD